MHPNSSAVLEILRLEIVSIKTVADSDGEREKFRVWNRRSGPADDYMKNLSEKISVNSILIFV